MFSNVHCKTFSHLVSKLCFKSTIWHNITSIDIINIVHRWILTMCALCDYKCNQTRTWRSEIHIEILYTALNSPSLIFPLWRSETESPSLEFAHSPISPVLNSPSGQRAKRAKIKRGQNFPCIQYPNVSGLYCKLVNIRHVPIFVSAFNDEFTYWRI